MWSGIEDIISEYIEYRQKERKAPESEIRTKLRRLKLKPEEVDDLYTRFEEEWETIQHLQIKVKLSRFYAIVGFPLAIFCIWLGYLYYHSYTGQQGFRVSFILGAIGSTVVGARGISDFRKHKSLLQKRKAEWKNWRAST